MGKAVKSPMQIEQVAIKSLKPHPKNPRIHPDSSLDKLVRSIKEFGWTNPILVSEDGLILAGHARLKAAQKAGLKEVPIIRLPLKGAKAEAYMIADNRIQQETDWDLPMLKDLLQELDIGELDITITGFDLPEIEDLMTQFHEPQEGLIPDDEIPEAPEPICKRGDLWQLGKHRLLCGDSTKPEDVKRLMAGEKADMGLTSPPYAVGKEYEADVSFTQHIELLKGFAASAILTIKPGGFLFINFGEIAPQSHAGKLTGSKRQCLYPISKDYWRIFHDDLKCDLYAMRVWYKPFNRLQQPFWTYHTSIPHHQEWEWLWTWRLPLGDGDQVFDWDISVRAVWDTRNEGTDDKPLTRHVAAFPVCLPERALKAHSAVNALVWEPFLGSGSTLIACEKLGRRCYGLEIEARYCDVVITRWEKFTGRKAELVKHGN
jgi:DNA modification methylase